MKKGFLILVIPVLVLFFFSGCFKDPKPQPCTYDACALKAPDAEIAAVQHYLDSTGITATPHCSGMFYKIYDAGTGPAPAACSTVGVAYRGMLTNGHVFDSSATGITLSLNRVIRGWANGVPLIKQGGRITLYIPPSLGYGSQEQRDQTNKVVIPANSITIFDIQLLAVY